LRHEGSLLFYINRLIKLSGIVLSISGINLLISS
jgi:hypothetical protein